MYYTNGLQVCKKWKVKLVQASGRKFIYACNERNMFQPCEVWLNVKTENKLLLGIWVENLSFINNKWARCFVL